MRQKFNLARTIMCVKMTFKILGNTYCSNFKRKIGEALPIKALQTVTEC